METKNGFGLSPLRCEGAPLHPDNCHWNLTDAQYLKQLSVYNEWVEENHHTIHNRVDAE